jgi:hypothetical protein
LGTAFQPGVCVGDIILAYDNWRFPLDQDVVDWNEAVTGFNCRYLGRVIETLRQRSRPFDEHMVPERGVSVATTSPTTRFDPLRTLATPAKTSLACPIMPCQPEVGRSWVCHAS